MSVLAYPPSTNEEFRRCTKQCGIVMSTEDQQYFALECVLCTERFLYLNAFIEHIRRKHASRPTSNEVRPNKRRHDDGEVNESLTGGHPPMPETSSVVIKEEKCYLDEDNPDDATCIKNEPLVNNDFDGYYGGQNDTNLSMTAEDSSYMADNSYAAESNASYNDDYEDDGETGGDDTNYDDMVEESLLNDVKKRALESKVENVTQMVDISADKMAVANIQRLLVTVVKQNKTIIEQNERRNQEFVALRNTLTESMADVKRTTYSNTNIQPLIFKTVDDVLNYDNELKDETKKLGLISRFKREPQDDIRKFVHNNLKIIFQDDNLCSKFSWSSLKSNIAVKDFNSIQILKDVAVECIPQTTYSTVEANSSPMPGVTNHIKDRKMIVFLIEAFRRNSFLWNPDHPQFRDRIKRNQFLKWMHDEFKRRYNLTLARDAITRKWENLRTVYKRECTRMALENTNISTLWYFKELYFLNHLYGGKQENMETVVQGAASRKRMFAIWNDVSTNKLIELLRVYACFYDRNHADYGNKEKKAEAFQQMANELAPIIEVTPIQISKRIAQLRYDYAKQKQERIRCEITGNIFTPNYSYYDQLLFMDSDIAPFKCDLCVSVLRSTQELDAHMMSHKQQNSQFSNISSSNSINPSGNSINDFNGGSNYFCPVCELCFNDLEQLNRHKQIHPQFREVRYQCDLCTASFRDKTIYDEHIRRHNDELLLPDLNLLPPIDNNAEIITGENSPYFSPADDSHSSSPKYKCNYAGCHREFTTRSNMMVHSKTHCSDEQFGCDVCGKVFRTSKNLQNHKQIHSAIKKYVCKICGSAFAQAAGLYLHKRRHNRQM